MNVVASAWLEYLADGPHAGFFAPTAEKTDDLLVPSLTRRMARAESESRGSAS